MNKPTKADICVIGAGSGGLSVAAGAVQMGASVILIEKNKMGGDCLNTGCVPSKALLAAGHAAQNILGAKKFGVTAGSPKINGRKVYNHIKNVIQSIEPNDSIERFEGLGVQVVQGAATFTSRQEVVVGEQKIHARRFVIATGSSPVLPPISGLNDIGALTNETIFELNSLPKHLIILGGGPIGIEMAQAHRQLGCQVTLLEMFSILSRDDADLADVVRKQLTRDGVEIFEGIKIQSAEKASDNVSIHYTDTNGDEITVTGSHVLVAAGRRANIDGLGLDKADVETNRAGISVDARLRTTNKIIFAIGDVAGGMQFTHVAGYHAGVIIRNILFRLPAKVDYRTVPRVSYTNPELAQVGLIEADARKAHKNIRILTHHFADNDRAVTEQDTAGFIKVITTKNGQIIGCGIVGAGAGEMIAPWVLAMQQKLKISAMASTIFPYPTRSEISKRVAGSFYTPSLFSEKTRKIVRFLRFFG